MAARSRATPARSAAARSAPAPALAAARAAAGEITASEGAERLGMTKQAIGLWTAKPGAPVRKVGTSVFLQWPAFARWREEELVTAAKREKAVGSHVDRKQAEEARQAEIRTALDEIALAERRAEFIAVAEYEAAIGSILDILTARLRALPQRFARAGRAAEELAEREVERLVVELHAWDDDVLDEDTGAALRDDPAADAERAESELADEAPGDDGDVA
jgi:hypothetical protein